jgi:hypothetical protein
MSDNINIEEILRKQFTNPEDKLNFIQTELVKLAFKEALEAAIYKCAEEAEVIDIGSVGLDYEGDSVWMEHKIVDKQSIFKVKQMIDYGSTPDTHKINIDSTEYS